MLGIKKYTDKMNNAAIQLTIDRHYFKLMNITIDHKTMLRKVDLFEKPHVITNWIHEITMNRVQTGNAIGKLRKK